MSEWSESNPIDYSPNGDDIDRFAQKTKAEFAAIYSLLNLLRRGGASAGLSDTDAEAYATHIDTTTGVIYMRDSENRNWLEMGRVAEHFGLSSADVGAVKNGGGVGAFYLGTDVNKNSSKITASTYDMYIAYDTCKFYIYYGGAWHVFLSLDFKDMLNAKDYVILRDEVGYSGNGKVLRLDEITGKANIDITGSPGKLLDKQIYCTNLHDGDVLQYDSRSDLFINKPKDELTRKDLTYTGEIDKIPVIRSDNKLDVNITGSPDRLLNRVIKIDKGHPLNHDMVLAFDEYMNAFIPKSRCDTDNIGGIPANLADIKDGQIIVYDSVKHEWTAKDKGTVGSGKRLTIRKGNKVIAEYDGDTAVSVDLGDDEDTVDCFVKNPDNTLSPNPEIFKACGNVRFILNEAGELTALPRVFKTRYLKYNKDGTVSPVMPE